MKKFLFIEKTDNYRFETIIIVWKSSATIRLTEESSITPYSASLSFQREKEKKRKIEFF